MDHSPSGAAPSRHGKSGVLLEPRLQHTDRNQPPASAADDAQLGHHVLFQEVDADTEGVSRLALRERETT